MRNISEWRLHIGAHKTATTYMQYALASCRKELAARGVDFLHFGDIRSIRFPPATGRFGWRAKLQKGRLARRMEDALEPLRSGQTRIAISEEDFIGSSAGLITNPFYPDLESKLRAFNVLCARGELHVFLSVRSFPEIIASAYAQVIKSRLVPGGFDSIRKEMLDHPPSWTGVVTRLKRALPKAHIRIWTFEHFIENEDEVMGEFCGTEVPRARSNYIPQETRTPRALAIARIEALDPSLSSDEHMAVVTRILDEDNGSEKYAPFTDPERSQLLEAYQSDLAHMRKEYPGILVGG